MRWWCLGVLSACAPTAAEPCLGLDHDLDGVCDREVADWSAEAMLPDGRPRTNIFELPEDALSDARDRGLQHAMVWPVDVSGTLIPFEAMHTILGPEGDATLQTVARATLGFGNLDEMYDWMGLARFGPEGGEHPYRILHPPGLGEGDPVGMGAVDTEWGDALTFSCASCHYGEMFGRTVVGLTNRRTRANAFFELAQTVVPAVDAETFGELTDAREEEVELYARTRVRLGAIGSKTPEVRGLDTSLAQVSLSLARRAEDADATRSPELESQPRPNGLETEIADSKPAVWWTLKYKTRWLSDGSLVSGNPIFTNLLWNELGRGTDLTDLEQWMVDNRGFIDDLTVAVFASNAPRWVDFFDDGLDIDAARRGEVLFGDHCASCHGTYAKNWDDPDDPTATTEVRYHPATPILDVGTDPGRAQGMQHFDDDLNRLAISEFMGAVVEVQEGYAPPPLDGIWSRYPYMHNNAMPTLCDVLLPAAERTEVFYQGPSDDPETDFDADCVGYPTGDAIPEAWTLEEDARFDVSRPGLSNAGHESMLLDASGDPIFDAEMRADLIAFLKTL